MNSTKKPGNAATDSEKRQSVVYIEIRSEASPGDSKTTQSFIYEQNLEPVAQFSVLQTGAYDDRKKEIRTFERTLKGAILAAKQRSLESENPVGLLLNSFEVFELDASLPVLDVLLNSIAGDSNLRPLYFADFPDANIDNLYFLAEVYKRRSERRKSQEEVTAKRASAIEDRVVDSEHHFTEKRNRLTSRLGKNQRRLLDENNVAAMKLVNQLLRQKLPRGRKITLMDMAVQLEKAGIATSTGKLHTPKSVSRLQKNLDEVKPKFRPFPPLEEYIVQRAGSAAGLPPAQAKALRQNMLGGTGGTRISLDELIPDAPEAPTTPDTHVEKEQRLREILQQTPQLIVSVNANTDALYPDHGDQDTITFRLRDNYEKWFLASLSIKIYNNLPAKDKDAYHYQTQWPVDRKELIIDIREETYLLPGRHYVETELDGDPFGQPFIVTLYRNKLGLTLVGDEVI